MCAKNYLTTSQRYEIGKCKINVLKNYTKKKYKITEMV